MKRLTLLFALVVSVASADGRLEDPRAAKAAQVSPLTGRLNLALEDLRLGPATPWPLSVRRSYLPGWGDPLNHGRAWVTVLDARLVPQQDGYLVLEPDGGLRAFSAVTGGWEATTGRPARLERTSSGFALRAVGGSARFDAQGRLESLTAGASTLTLVRDAAGRASALRGPWGELQVVRDEAGLLQSLRAPDGQAASYLRDASGALVEVQRLGVRERYTYDAQGRLSGFGGVAHVRYDDRGRVIELAAEGLAPARYTFADDPEHDELVGTCTQGERVERTVASGDLRRIRVEGPSGVVSETELDERGRVVRQREDGVETTRRYDAQGRVLELVVDGRATRFSYDDPQSPVPARAQTPAGSWTFTHDASGNLTSARSSAGAFRWVYDDQGRLVAAHGPRGLEVQLGYDAQHRKVSYRAAVGDVVKERRIERPEQVLGTTTVTQLDDGRTRSLTRTADGGLRVQETDAAGRALRSLRYDALGRPQERTSARGVVRRFAYDALGRWTALSGAEGERLRASYDAFGDLAALTDGNGNATRFLEEDGWQVVESPSWGRRATRHAASSRVDRAGEAELASTFNERGQLIGRSLPEGEQRFRYDAEGRLLEARGPQGGLRYAYDDRGRLSRVGLIGVEAEVRYTYDAEGRLGRAELPWGAVDYRYDEAGRLSALDLGPHGTIALSYDAQGRRTQIAYPSGVVTTFRYQGDWPLAIETRKGDALLERRAYAYGADGRLEATEELAGRVAYERDAEGQLVAASGPDFARAYAYDVMGNRTAVERDGARLEAEVAPGNRLAALGDEAFAYGALGALSERGAEGARTRYTYDSLNRLVAAALPDGGEVRYGYAPDGTRIWREDAAGRTWFVPGATGTVAELDAAGEVQVGYLQGAGLDDLLGAVHAGAFFAAHTDAVKSVTALTDAEGQVAARYRYTPFGEAVSAEGAEWNHLRYTARPLDPATGLYDLRARQYAPDLGRFTSPDPLGQRGGANLYAYVQNDPTLLRDPLGLFPGFDIPGPIDDFVEDRIDDVVDLGSDVVDAGSDFAGDAWDWGVDAADWAFVSGPLGIDHNPFFFGGIPNPFALEETLAFGRGFLSATWATIRSPYDIANALYRDPLGTLRAFGEFGALITMPWLAVPYAIFGPEDNAVRTFSESFLGGVGNYWDAFLNDPEEFWRRNGEIAPIVVGAVLTDGGSATVAALIELNNILGYIGYASAILENATVEETPSGRFSVTTIPGVSFEDGEALTIGLVVAAVTDLQIAQEGSGYRYSSDLLDESYTDYHEYVEAALELPEVQDVLAEGE